jgi:hypothetical protein
MSAGKGDKPRNCFSKKFKENFDQIKWPKTTESNDIKVKKTKQKASYAY